MPIPLEITFHGVEKVPALEELIREKAERLEHINKRLMRCRVAIEKPHRHKRHGSGWRVRIDLTLPPRQELVINEEPGLGAPPQEDLHQVVTEAFHTAERKLRKMTDKIRGETKRHPAAEPNGVIKRVFVDHGFLHGEGGYDVYFHRNSLLGIPFEELTVGTAVHYTEEEGEDGPQASSVHVLARSR
ncbi:HPF/RaiA family ribosome-associated protein [bacterium CPR1]|nr:HPF/RaiA family ribosome-associated protein [bacterium CPR1]